MKLIEYFKVKKYAYMISDLTESDGLTRDQLWRVTL
ncbi:hypothetical protein BVRB_6g137330 [Beta vulgaris subsp. vulgaris]|nr:hypothetical protein BVRB_6g137330 [Beta vulgaris subsp. vulgaris]